MSVLSVDKSLFGNFIKKGSLAVSVEMQIGSIHLLVLNDDVLSFHNNNYRHNHIKTQNISISVFVVQHNSCNSIGIEKID